MVDEQEEQGAGTEGESGTQEKRGRASKKSKASDSELIGIVSLYRLRFGNERQTPETAREQVRESGCGTPWKRDETSELQRLLADLGNIGEEDRGQGGTRGDEDRAGSPGGGSTERRESWERAGDTEREQEWRRQRDTRQQARDRQWERDTFGSEGAEDIDTEEQEEQLLQAIAEAGTLMGGERGGEGETGGGETSGARDAAGERQEATGTRETAKKSQRERRREYKASKASDAQGMRRKRQKGEQHAGAGTSGE